MKEIIDIKDIFENERIVIMEFFLINDGIESIKLSAGIKDDDGDIFKITELILIYH